MPYATKCISLPFRFGGDNDWGLYGNRDYIISTARCHWVRLWVIWSDIEPNQPAADLWARWATYNANPYFRALDNVIADANANGVAVLLAMSQYMPLWANGATGPEPGTGKEARRRLPLDTSTSSYWASFLAYLYARYWSVNGVGVVNPTGPINAAGRYLGNPRGARISGLGIVNEPNYEAWQEYEAGCVEATMMKTMDSVAAFWDAASGRTGSLGSVMFAPDLADTEDRFDSGSGVRTRTDYLRSTKSTLALLDNWQPRKVWAWSHHCYDDVRNGNNAKANQVRLALEASNWPNNHVYTTEGGYNMGGYSAANETRQRNLVVNHWNLTRSSAARMGTQHTIRGTAGTYEMVAHAANRNLPLWQAFADLTPRRP